MFVHRLYDQVNMKTIYSLKKSNEKYTLKQLANHSDPQKDYIQNYDEKSMEMRVVYNLYVPE